MREPPTKRAASGAGAPRTGETGESAIDLFHHGAVLDRARRRNHHFGASIIAR